MGLAFLPDGVLVVPSMKRIHNVDAPSTCPFPRVKDLVAEGGGKSHWLRYDREALFRSRTAYLNVNLALAAD